MTSQSVFLSSVLELEKYILEMGFDKNKTADEIMLENNIHKIYDCGTIRYTLKLD